VLIFAHPAIIYIITVLSDCVRTKLIEKYYDCSDMISGQLFFVHVSTMIFCNTKRANRT